jgi:cytochrome d ubiquinol oxidase subunit II
MFSALYSALMLLLFALILRGVSFEFRGKVDNPLWRKIWDGCIFIGSFVPALLLGVAFANIFKGIPIDQDGIYHGNLLTLLNPYGLMGGVLFVCLFLMHGSLWIGIRTENELHERSVGLARKLWPVYLVIAVLFLVASAVFTDLYNNYLANPLFFLIILLTVAGVLGIKFYLSQNAIFKAWCASAVTIIGATFFGVAGLFPNLFPSTLKPEYSLTAYNASSSPLTLKIMLMVVVVFIPIVIAYQIWVYTMFTHKITQEDLDYEEAY